MLSSDGERVVNLVSIPYKKGQFDSKKAFDKNLSIDEIISLEKASEFDVDYVYFRHFPERPDVALPQVYIFDYTNKEFDKEEIIEKHRRLFSAVQVPMFFVFLKTEVKIFNCFKAPWKKNKLEFTPFESIELAAESLDLIRKFSAKRIDNGLFWENTDVASHFKFKGSAYERLLQELKTTLKKVLDEEILPASLAKKLLVKSILIKYLEERKDEEGNTVFPKAGDVRLYKNGTSAKKEYQANFFEQFVEGATSFVHVLREKGACVELFKYLSKHFNGEIFRFNLKDFEILRNTDLNSFADFLDTKVESTTRQTVLWELYSFADLPIELISNVYEEFLDKKRGVVYTPPFLVNFLLDEAMPLTNSKTDFKILDPACGSGVFLVGAYKRLIYRWRSKNKWKKPDIQTLQRLMAENIFGVDKESEAVNLAVFSLILALCDELSPISIWDNLRFDNLRGKNLFDQDFFELILSEGLESDFDLVIGNPPFVRKLTTPSAAEIEKNREKERKLIWKGKEEKIKIPGKQIALLFLDQAIKLCKPNGQLCLILPATDFLYNYNSNKYRTWFFQNYHVDQVIDFTNLSGSLFGSANVSVISLFAKNYLAENVDSISHITVRRNHLSEEKLFFELDHYDFHSIPFDESIGRNFAWKANLFGGGRLARILLKLSKIETLGDFLKNKEKEDWVYGEGYIVGNRNKIKNLRSLEEGNESIKIDELKLLKKTYKKAKWLTNKSTIDSDFNEFTLKEEYFIRNRASIKKIFEPPHIIIKEVISEYEIPLIYSNQYLSFNDRMVGIRSSVVEKKMLELIFNLIKNKTSIFYTALISSKYAITQNNTTSIVKRDIDRIPFPLKDIERIDLSKIEQILRNDTIDFWFDYATKSKKGARLFQKTSPSELLNFGKIYCTQLNSTYEDFQPAEPITTDSFICFPFYMGEKPLIDIPDKNKLEDHLQKLLVIDNPTANLRINRILRLYERNVIYLVKPKQLRYWLQSVAIRDADETFADLVTQEYQL